MRVVIDAISAREGGGQTYLRNLLAYDPGEGIQVFVLATPSLSLPRLGQGVTRVDAPEMVVRPIPRAAWGRVGIPPLLRDLRPDVLFCPGGTLPCRPPPECRSITMSRNMLPFDAGQRRRYPLGYARAKARILERVLLQSMLRSDLVIFVSNHAKEVIEHRVGGRLQRTAVIPHGVSSDFHQVARNPPRPSWLPREDYVLYVSNLEPYKSHLEVIRAFAVLKRRLPGHEKLVLVGRETVRPHARAVRREIELLGLRGDVILAGPRPHEELPAVNYHARAGVFASECENCPNILLESMAAGLPMAVSDVAPMPEFAAEAVTYFDPRRPDAIADRLEALLTNQRLAQQLSKRGLARASLYDWSVTARRTWATALALWRCGPNARPESRAVGRKWEGR